MGLRVGLDFGTATTCVSVIHPATQIPVVVPVHNATPFVDSQAWFDTEPGRAALVPVQGSGRAPRTIFEAARRDFEQYWQARVEAQSDGGSWERWEQAGREAWMLLSYFKPELADLPSMVERQVVSGHQSRFDPMAQSEELVPRADLVVYATPAPATNDYVAATAALIQEALRQVTERYNDRIDVLMLGVPALNALEDAGEAARGRDHRDQAIVLADIKERFGTPQFRHDYRSEAFAAGAALDIRGDQRNPTVLVIDVGAGTTDIALVAYSRGASGRCVPVEELEHCSFRLAGRDINIAIADYLRDTGTLRDAYRIMDGRSWQILLDNFIEDIKRDVTSISKRFTIPLRRIALCPETLAFDREQRARLNRTAEAYLSLGELQLERFMTRWRSHLGAFLELIDRAHPHLAAELVTVELVGGACRFEPLRAAIEAEIAASPFDGTPVRFRDDAMIEAQTVVARGLANEALHA